MSMISRYLEAEVPDPNLPEDLYMPGAFDRTVPDPDFEMVALGEKGLDKRPELWTR